MSQRKEGTIGLVINSYVDIFSSFDPRSYSQRALSVDFLDEVKRASKDKVSNERELDFLIPSDKRDLSDERTIKKRLKEYFRKHFVAARKEKLRVLRQGIYFIFFGIALMLLGAFVLFKFRNAQFFTTFLVVLLEPGGWFLFWEGLDLVVFESKKKNPELEFYEKMSKAEINFVSRG